MTVNFEQDLKKNGLKITPQRITILQEIQKMGHATIEEIYENILRIYPSISLATIYKNILALCEVDILKEVKVSLQKQRYEINDSEHSHLVCHKCGKLEDIVLETQSLFLSKSLPKNFEITSTAVTLYGICQDCKK